MIPPQLVEIATRLLSPSADAPSDVSNTTPDNTDQLIREIFNRYPMEHTASDQYTSLLNQFPTRNQPTKTQNVLGLLSGLGAGAHAATYDNGTPIGFRGGSAEDVMKATDLTRFRPFYQEMGDWQAKVKPFEAAALNERYYNQNQRTLASNEARQVTTAKNVASQVERREAQTTGEAEKRDIEWYKAWIQNQGLNQPNIGLAVDGATNTIIQYDKKGGKPAAALIDPLTGEPMKGEKLPLLNKSLAAAQKRAETIVAGQNQRTNATIAAGNKRAELAKELVDPETGQVYRPDINTGEYLPVQGVSSPTSAPTTVPTSAAPTGQTPNQVPNQVPTPTRPKSEPLPTGLTKPGAKPNVDITTQTKTMMEGAKTLLPQVPKLMALAKQLDDNNMFGVVGSRLRTYATKIGTVGNSDYDIDKTVNNLNNIAGEMLADPVLNSDELVGQFTMALSLMSSAMGRVHGGARGGGSIEMIKYMKNALSDLSSYKMFKGRLEIVEDYLKEYAAGPKSKKNSDKLDKALDKIFGPKG